MNQSLVFFAIAAVLVVFAVVDFVVFKKLGPIVEGLFIAAACSIIYYIS